MVDVTASSKTDLHWKLKSGFTRFELIEVNVVFSERNCFFLSDNNQMVHNMQTFLLRENYSFAL